MGVCPTQKDQSSNPKEPLWKVEDEWKCQYPSIMREYAGQASYTKRLDVDSVGNSVLK